MIPRTVLLTVSTISVFIGHLVSHSGLHKNDDGPPGPNSPYIYGLYRRLTQELGKLDAKVFTLSNRDHMRRLGCQGGGAQLPKILDR